MREHAPTPSDTRQRFPPAIIAHGVWGYCRFALHDGDVAELLAERDMMMTCETTRRWCRMFSEASGSCRAVGGGGRAPQVPGAHARLPSHIAPGK